MDRLSWRFALCALVAMTLDACGGAPTVLPATGPAATSTAVTSTAVTSTADAGPDIETDSDGDGIADVRDECVHEAEIYNTVEDEDGCPDTGPIVLY